MCLSRCHTSILCRYAFLWLGRTSSSSQRKIFFGISAGVRVVRAWGISNPSIHTHIHTYTGVTYGKSTALLCFSQIHKLFACFCCCCGLQNLQDKLSRRDARASCDSVKISTLAVEQLATQGPGGSLIISCAGIELKLETNPPCSSRHA